jgi:hypothetical protein
MTLTGEIRRNENSLSWYRIPRPKTEHEVPWAEFGKYLWTGVATILQLDTHLLNP